MGEEKKSYLRHYKRCESGSGEVQRPVLVLAILALGEGRVAGNLHSDSRLHADASPSPESGGALKPQALHSPASARLRQLGGEAGKEPVLCTSGRPGASENN